MVLDGACHTSSASRLSFDQVSTGKIICQFFVVSFVFFSGSSTLTDSMHHVKSEHCKDNDDDDDLTDDERKAEQQHMMNSHPNLNHLSHHHHNHGPYQHHHHAAMMNAYPHAGAAIKEEMLSNSKNQTSGEALPASSKPKIWSLADTAACKTPPLLVQSQHGAWMPTNPYQSAAAAAGVAAHMTHSHPATHNPHQSGIGTMMMMNAGAGGNGHPPPPNHIAGMNMTGGNMNGLVYLTLEKFSKSASRILELRNLNFRMFLRTTICSNLNFHLNLF